MFFTMILHDQGHPLLPSHLCLQSIIQILNESMQIHFYFYKCILHETKKMKERKGKENHKIQNYDQHYVAGTLEEEFEDTSPLILAKLYINIPCKIKENTTFVNVKLRN